MIVDRNSTLGLCEYNAGNPQRIARFDAVQCLGSVEYFSSICNEHVGAGIPVGICPMIPCFVASPITVYQCFSFSPHLEPSVAVSLHDYEKNNAKVSHPKHWLCFLVSFNVYQFVYKMSYHHSRKNHLRQDQGVCSRPKKGVPRP